MRGLLLHGKPGTGKTLIAREIAKALNAREPKIVNGPEILDHAASFWLDSATAGTSSGTSSDSKGNRGINETIAITLKEAATDQV